MQFGLDTVAGVEAVVKGIAYPALLVNALVRAVVNGNARGYIVVVAVQTFVDLHAELAHKGFCAHEMNFNSLHAG